MMAPMIPEPSEPQDFDYDALGSETQAVVRQRTSELKSLIRRTARDIIEIGEILIEVRKQLGYGKFRKWLSAEFTWSHQAASRFIQVAERFSCLNLRQLDIAASALYLLARPSTPEEARQEALERAAQGETITHAAAKQIIAHHTIDVEAETVAEEEQPPIPVQSTPKVVSPSSPDPDQAREEAEPPAEPYKPGDRIRILRRQDGQDKWSGKTARIREITPDGRLRVDVERAKGVRFTLNPEWVEPMETPESYKVQPEQAPQQPNEPDPESPVISNDPSGKQTRAIPRFQAGDQLYINDPNQQEQQWVGEVAEVIEVADDRVQVIIEIPRPNP